MQAWATTVRVAACGLVSLVLLGAVMTTPAMSDESVGAESELQAFYRDFLEASFAMRPLSATFLGDHRFDDQLDDISAAARARWLAHDRDTLAALEQRFGEAAAAGRLSADDALDYRIFRDDLERSIWLTENFQPFADDPRVYGGYLSDSVYSLVAQSTLPKETNVANAIARMRQLPRIVAEAKATLATPPASARSASTKRISSPSSARPSSRPSWRLPPPRRSGCWKAISSFSKTSCSLGRQASGDSAVSCLPRSLSWLSIWASPPKRCWPRPRPSLNGCRWRWR